MRIIRLTIWLLIVFVVVAFVTALFLLVRADSSHGSHQEEEHFIVERGQSLWVLADRLKQAGIIESKWGFLLTLIEEKKYRALQAGEYALSGKMTIPEIIDQFATGKIVPPGVKITFPEGWTLEQMAERLTANNLPGKDFQAIAEKPFAKWQERFPLLSTLPKNVSLEGYLFPDTYIFPKEATGELIVNSLLKEFSTKITPDMLAQAKTEGLSLHELITLSSIVEAEVPNEADRAMVADIFLRRLKIGQALQSDATLRYALGIKKIQYSVTDTENTSRYNTYAQPGLPPGPIGNPGLSSIQAVLHPTPNEYYYFLSNPTTGVTVYAKTFDEHVRNKQQNGL